MLVKSLWASVQGDPVFMRRVNGWATVFWIVATGPICYLVGGNPAERFLVFVSCYAAITGHWSAWQAARVEVAQAIEAARVAEEDLAGQVVEKIVSETTVESDTQ